MLTPLFLTSVLALVGIADGRDTSLQSSRAPATPAPNETDFLRSRELTLDAHHIRAQAFEPTPTTPGGALSIQLFDDLTLRLVINHVERHPPSAPDQPAVLTISGVIAPNSLNNPTTTLPASLTSGTFTLSLLDFPSVAIPTDNATSTTRAPLSLISAGFWNSHGSFGIVPTGRTNPAGEPIHLATHVRPEAVVRCAMNGRSSLPPDVAVPADRTAPVQRVPFPVATTPNETTQACCAHATDAPTNAPLAHNHPVPPAPRGNPAPNHPAPRGIDPCEALDDQSTIDILVVYTALARDAAGGLPALQTRVQNAFDATNAAFTNSLLNTGAANRLQVRLAGLVEIAYAEQSPPPADWLQHLVRVTDTDDGFMDTVHALRDQYNADTVSLIIDDPAFTGGTGWWALWDQAQAFTCCNWRGIGGGSLLFAHELGHNLGCAHNYENDPVSPTFYGRGHHFTHQGTSYGTIMSYIGDVRIQGFSNPLITQPPTGQPTGAPLDSPLPAWAARTIAQTRWTLANYRRSGRIIDCNGNGIADPIDIASATSLDTNHNCRPDEAEDRLYVDAAAPGEGDGVSWNTSIKQLANATFPASLRFNNIREIWVADGLYTPDFFGPTQTADRYASFSLASSVSLHGGFQGRSRPGGGETSLSQRTNPPTAFPSILSGNIGNTSTPTDNAYSVISIIDTLSTPTFDGFVIEHGYSDWAGAGLYARNATLAVSNSLFRHNRSGSGAAASLADDAVASFSNCTFENNTAALYGGGALELFNASASIDRSTFRSNAGAWGGAIAIGAGSTADIRSSTFTANTATVYNGGALDVDSSILTLANSLLANNTSTLDGGAVWTATNSTVAIVNSTIANNHAGTYTGGLVAYFDDVNIAGTVFWGNTGSYEAVQDRQVLYFGATGGLRYSRVEGWNNSLSGPGNSGADPRFTNPSASDFSLLPNSSCIDAGDTPSLLALPGVPITLDLLDAPRRFDDPATANAGLGPTPIVDIGAIEYQGATCAGDFNHDGDLNSQDFFDFLAAFFSANPAADVNHDSVINSQDFFDFLVAFFTAC